MPLRHQQSVGRALRRTTRSAPLVRLPSSSLCRCSRFGKDAEGLLTLLFRSACCACPLCCFLAPAASEIDSIHLDEVDRLAHAADTVVISCQEKLNLDLLLDKIWVRTLQRSWQREDAVGEEGKGGVRHLRAHCSCIASLLRSCFLILQEYLAFIRIYTKPRGKRPDFSQSFSLPLSSSPHVRAASRRADEPTSRCQAHELD